MNKLQFRFHWKPGHINIVDIWTKYHTERQHKNFRKEILTSVKVVWKNYSGQETISCNGLLNNVRVVNYLPCICVQKKDQFWLKAVWLMQIRRNQYVPAYQMRAHFLYWRSILCWALKFIRPNYKPINTAIMLIIQ